MPKGAGGPRQIARSLDTTDYAEALRRAPIAVAAIRREIESLRRHPDGTRRDVKGDATDELRRIERWWAEHREPHPTEPGKFMIPSHLEPQWEADVDQLLGDPINAEDGYASPAFAPTRQVAAKHLIGVTLGDRVPVGSELDRYLKQQGIKASYAARTRRAVEGLREWMSGQSVGDSVNAVRGREADAFADHLSDSGLTTATVNSLTSALSAYWRWMVKREIAKRNPWAGQVRRVVDLSRNAKKRPFSDDEILALLTGPAGRTLHDVMRIAALSGMRLTEIGGLRVKGVGDGIFHVEESKTSSGVRSVPVHPDLAAVVARRIEGKADGDYLIEELTSPPSHGGRRGKKVGELFTAYRKELGLDERREGRRQADADFHSFRRWFVTKAEEAGLPEWQVARVVGHKPAGFTYGTYSGGGAHAQNLAVVKAVRWPSGTPLEGPERL